MQLRQLPFTDVKLDQNFVMDVDRSRDSRLIIRSIIELAHGLGLIATAEGVETVGQLRTLTELGCDQAQGYLISEPMPPEALEILETVISAQVAGPDGRGETRPLEPRAGDAVTRNRCATVAD